MNFIDSIISGESARRPYPHFAVQRVSAPTVEPVTVQEMKDLTRIRTTSQDAMMLRLIRASRIQLENIVAHSFIDTTWTQTQDFVEGTRYPEWIYRYQGTAGRIELRRRPLLSVTSFQYIPNWESDTPLTLSSSQWVVSNARNEVMMRLGSVVPSHRNYQSILFTFRAGFYQMSDVNDATEKTNAQVAVPDDIKMAVCMYAGSMYADPEGVGAGAIRNVSIAETYGALPHGVKQLIDPYIQWRLK